MSLNWLPATLNTYGSHVGSSYGAHAGSLRSGKENLNINAISDRYSNEENDAPSAYSGGSLPNNKVDDWEEFYNKIRNFITGIDGRAMDQAIAHFDPYSPEIADFSDDDMVPSMEVLDLLWDTRAYNGRGGVTNYGPDAGGRIYDKLTGLSFVPQNIGLDGVEWAERNPFFKKRDVSTF